MRVRLDVAYDGAPFAGFAANPGVKTVGGTLAASIEKVLRHPVRLTCAGRTDAGVHAWGQVVTFDAAEDGLDLVALQRAVNKMCAPSIVVRAASVAEPDFDARFSARARRYRYTVLNTPTPSPFLAQWAWHVPEPLDLRVLRMACDPLIGEHDFTSFCRRPKVPAGVSFTMVRRVIDARWHDLGDGVLRFDVEATSFCQQMVRSLTSILVEAGLGKRTAADVKWALEAQDRQAAAPPAPPHGLVLWEVVY